jgi:hypothetical protein
MMETAKEAGLGSADKEAMAGYSVGGEVRLVEGTDMEGERGFMGVTGSERCRYQTNTKAIC